MLAFFINRIDFKYGPLSFGVCLITSARCVSVSYPFVSCGFNYQV